MFFGRSEWAPVAASFGLAALLYASTPSTAGYDDLGSLIARLAAAQAALGKSATSTA